jgi:hypothetical protein
MQRREHFGRRAVPEREPPRAPSAVAKAMPPAVEIADRIEPVSALLELRPADDDLDRELAEWKAARKLRKRSFREPWRSVSIAAAIGFGASNWLLPDSVAQIADFVSMGLFAVGIIAGLRRRPTG